MPITRMVSNDTQLHLIPYMSERVMILAVLYIRLPDLSNEALNDFITRIKPDQIALIQRFDLHVSPPQPARYFNTS